MNRRPRLALLVAVAMVVLAACSSAGEAPAPTAPATPPTSDDSAATISASAVPNSATAAAIATAANASPSARTDPAGTTDPPAPIAPGETDVWIPAGDHRVPGTLAMPAVTPGQPVPAVLLLHGDLGDRDAGGMFVRLAAALADRGIASLRIDFAGTGQSEESDLSLDYPGMVLDATASLTYLEQDAALDPERLALLGFSRGGSIAATVAGTVPGVAALVSWSGAIANGSDEDPDDHQKAREDGYVAVDLGGSDFRLSLSWFDTIADSHPLDDVAGYTNPVLAVVGSDDDIVPPETSDIFLATVASTDKTLYTIDGADHGFTAEQEYGDEAVAVTTDWLATKLAADGQG